jgi:hypothetical protein
VRKENHAHFETAMQAALDDGLAKLGRRLNAKNGPFSDLLSQFDPTSPESVYDGIRSVVDKALRRVVTAMEAEGRKQADEDRKMREALAESLAKRRSIAAAEEARLKEAQRGSAKGREHEISTEAALGELLAVTGDGLDDVSTVLGVDGSKRGDKILQVKGGCRIVIEDSTQKKGRSTEATARRCLTEAMSNRDARLGILIVDSEEKVPGRQPFHVIDDDKAVVLADKSCLRLIFLYFRHKAVELDSRSSGDDLLSVDRVNVIRAHIENMERTLSKFSRIRGEATKATKAVASLRDCAEEIARSITQDTTAMLGIVDSL